MRYPRAWPGEKSYADTFLMPFVRSLEALGIDLEIVRSEELNRGDSLPAR